MKAALLMVIILATLPAIPPGSPSTRIDISGKSNVEIVGAGDAKVQIVSKDGAQMLVASYPKTGASVFTHYVSGEYRGMFIQRRVGSQKSVLFDSDGDGLPEVRHSFEILPSGEEKLTKIERLTWTALDAK